MPTFYFDVRKGELFVPDEAGMDLADLDAAAREAAETAALIGRDHLLGGHRGSVVIGVRDDRGRPVLTITLSLSVVRL